MQLKIIFQLLLCAFCVNTLPAQTDLIPFRKGNLWGFSKPDKTIVIPCQYDEVHFFENHKALIRKGLFYGLVDETGREVYPCKSYIPIIYHCGRAKVAKKIATLPHDAHTGHGRVLTKIFSEYGFIDEKGTEIKTGKIMISFSYDKPFRFINGKALVSKKDKIGMIDRSENVLLPIEYTFVGDDQDSLTFREGLVALCKGQKVGFMDSTYQEVIPFEYQRTTFKNTFFSDGLAVVVQRDKHSQDKFGFINHQNQVIVPFTYGQCIRLRAGACVCGRQNPVYGYDV